MVDAIRNGERGLSVRNKLNTLIEAFNTGALATGPVNNLFGATSGDVKAEPLGVNPATNLTAAEGVRDAYFTANPTNLQQYDDNEGYHMFLYYLDGSDTKLLAQRRVGSAWVDAVGIVAIQGQAGTDGLDGTALEFTSVAERDTFFQSRPDLLRNNLPILVTREVGQSREVSLLVWTGATNPPSYNPATDAADWIVATLEVGSGSLLLGPEFTLSNGVQALSLTLGNGRQALVVSTEYDNSGSTHPFIYSLAALQVLEVNLVDDLVINGPFTLNYSTFGNNLTQDFSFKPAEAGTLRATFRDQGLPGNPVIFDETRTVTQAEVDSDLFLSFGVGNRYILDQNQNLQVTFEGIDLKGGVVNDPSSPFNGQTIIAFKSDILPFTRKNLALEEDYSQVIVDAVRFGAEFRFTRKDGSTFEVSSAEFTKVYQHLGQGANGHTIQIDNVASAWAHFHPDAGNASGVVLPNTANVGNDISFLFDLTEVDSDLTFTLQYPNMEFRDGATSLTLRAGHVARFWCHTRLPSSPISPTNPLVCYETQALTVGAVSNVQADADEQSPTAPSYIRNFQKYRDMLAAERNLGIDRVGVWSDVSPAAVGDLISVSLPVGDSSGLLHWTGAGLIPPQGYVTVAGSTGEDVEYSRVGIRTITLEVGEDKSGAILVYHEDGNDKYVTEPKPDHPEAFVIGHVLNASLPGQQVSMYYDLGQSLLAAAYLATPSQDGLHEIYCVLGAPDGGNGNRSFPFNTLVNALTEAGTLPSGQHKVVHVPGVENLGQLTNTSGVSNVGNLIVKAGDCTLTGVTLGDHATTVFARVVDGNVQLADQCSLQVHNIVNPTSATVTFTSEVHANTLLKSRRMESTVSIDFSALASGSRVIVQIDHYEANVATALATIPSGVEVSGWMGDIRLPLEVPVFANFEGLPENFNVLNELQKTFNVIYDLKQADHMSAIGVVARRGTVTQALTENLNVNLDGRNTGTIEFTSADITALAAQSGDITVSATATLGNISHAEIHLATIRNTNGRVDVVPASETRNYVKAPTGGSYQIGDLEGKILYANANAAIDLEDAGFPLVFDIYCIGSGVEIAGVNGATVNGSTSPSSDKYVRVMRTANNTYQAIELN